MRPSDNLRPDPATASAVPPPAPARDGAVRQATAAPPGAEPSPPRRPRRTATRWVLAAVAVVAVGAGAVLVLGGDEPSDDQARGTTDVPGGDGRPDGEPAPAPSAGGSTDATYVEPADLCALADLAPIEGSVTLAPPGPSPVTCSFDADGLTTSPDFHGLVSYVEVYAVVRDGPWDAESFDTLVRSEAGSRHDASETAMRDVDGPWDEAFILDYAHFQGGDLTLDEVLDYGDPGQLSPAEVAEVLDGIGATGTIVSSNLNLRHGNLHLEVSIGAQIVGEEVVDHSRYEQVLTDIAVGTMANLEAG